MSVDPMEFVERDEQAAAAEQAKSALNTLVAITVALLATFMAICSVKGNNIGQAMQQAQADKIDNYAWYQARNIREEVNRAAAAQLKAQAVAAPAEARAVYERDAATFERLAEDQADKKRQQQAAAEQADKTYAELNMHDDQFDMSEASLSIAISLLAVTALTQKRWLYWLAMLPTAFGLFMGLAGLLGSNIHPDILARLLT